MALKSWGIASFTVDTWTELVVGEAGEETVLFSLLLSNYSAENEANFSVQHYAADGTTVNFQWVLGKAVGETPTALQVPIVVPPGGKIEFKCDVADASVLASGEAK